MSALTGRIETNVERAAAALFAAAVGYAAYTLLNETFAASQLLAYAGAAAALGYILSMLGMRAAAGGKRHVSVPIFDVREFDTFEPDELLLTERLNDELVLTDPDRAETELLLTDADRTRSPAAEEPLELDDVLAAVSADDRVVRLFDRKAMPTPGQLGSSIDRHLERELRPAYPDAAQALSDALAELRRSLR